MPIGTIRASILASKATTIGVDLAALHLSGLSNALGIAELCVLNENILTGVIRKARFNSPAGDNTFLHCYNLVSAP